MQQHIDALFLAIDAGQSMADIMQEDEAAAGYRIVHPGDEPWLSATDWRHDITVSVDDKTRTVRLVAILALRPGNGALRRTICGIIAAGLTPCIIAPTNEMRATCIRWGWRRKDIGVGWDHEEQWRPTVFSRGPNDR